MNPFAPLTTEDFPLRAMGASVYRRTHSSAMFVAPNEWLAADLAARLNAYEFGKRGVNFGVMSVPVDRDSLVFTIDSQGNVG